MSPLTIDEAPIEVCLFGAGRLGRQVYAGLSRVEGVHARLLSARDGVPRDCKASLVLLAVRDGQVRAAAQAWAEVGRTPLQAVFLHAAGSLPDDEAKPLRGHCRGIGRWHPMVALASPDATVRWEQVHVTVGGDAPAVEAAVALTRWLGAQAHQAPGLDTTLYHAGASLLAGGTVTLLDSAQQLLTRAGVPAPEAKQMLLSLLRSVVDNLDDMSVPAALTGPVRRGDLGTVNEHLAQIEHHLPELASLYRTMVRAQVPLAAQSKEHPKAVLDQFNTLLNGKVSGRPR